MYGFLEQLRSANPIFTYLFWINLFYCFIMPEPDYILECKKFQCWLFLPRCKKKKKQELIVLPLNFVAGGVMGYMKSGSQKSLAAGGISALVLYFVHTQLPVRPVFASSIGLGMQNLFFSDPLAIFFAWKFDQPGFLT